MNGHHSASDEFFALVTGANSGLGYAICCRLIDEFLETRPQSARLVLIITTRSQKKSDDTIKGLRAHLQSACQDAERKTPGVRALLEKRVRFHPERLDLTSILSVQHCAKRLRESIPKLDAIVMNAGIGAFTGVAWSRAIWSVLTDWKYAVTWPTYKLAATGWVKAQMPEGSKAQNKKDSEAVIGEVFCANVFGHYLLAHYLRSRLDRRGSKGRIIWISSMEAYASMFSLDDFQAIKSDQSYESSKRLTDILALTYDLPSTKPWVDSYIGPEAKQEKDTEDVTASRPRMYLAHPGICSSAIFPLPWILLLCMEFAFYVARWLGSIWHPIKVYKGAVAPVWLALASQETLDDMESIEGKGKWGSATDRCGHERVERTEVEGWGWGGIVGERIRRKGRWRYAKDVTQAGREEFEELGRKCWQEMETLRVEWEARLEPFSPKE